MFAGPLSGFTVAVTADRRADEQAELIARRGADVIRGPVIRTLPLGAEGAVEQATAELIAHPPDITVLSTGLGVRGWFSSAEGLGFADALRDLLNSSEVLARGPKASGAALTFGIQVDWVAPTATYREILERLDRAPRRRPDGHRVRVAVQLDGSPEPELADAVADLGFEVVAVPVYRWHLPAELGPAERVVAAVADRSVDAVSFTSAHSVSNFAAIAEQSGRWTEVRSATRSGAVAALCVGPVTAERVRTVGLGHPIEPRTARLGAMVQALVDSFSRRRRSVELRGARLVCQGRLVSVDGAEPVKLTYRERKVLEALARQPGAVLSKRALLAEVWSGESDDHVVEVTVGRLRRRLGRAGDAVETVVRRGYRLATP